MVFLGLWAKQDERKARIDVFGEEGTLVELFLLLMLLLRHLPADILVH